MTDRPAGRTLTIERDHAAILMRDGDRIVFAGSPESAEAHCDELGPEAALEVRRLGAIARDWRGDQHA